VSVSIEVRRELVELANRMVELSLARSRSHAFNIMKRRGCAAWWRRLSAGRGFSGGRGSWRGRASG